MSDLLRRNTTTSLRAARALALALALVLGISPAFAALDRETAAAGLKEALQQGVGRAVDVLGQLDGFLQNPDVRIPLPDKLESAGNTLRKIGFDGMVDEFETSMNRAAEAAVPLAKDVFVDTIKQMSFADALAIVRGEQHEATDYLREHAGPVLAERFRPIVQTQLDEVGATRAFNSLVDRVSRLPLMDAPAMELDQYVTGEALDGLFLMIAREEEKIRQDPAARTSELLRKVFGGEEEGEKRPWWKRVLRRR